LIIAYLITAAKINSTSWSNRSTVKPRLCVSSSPSKR